jgi:hypothetical protein
VDGTGSTLSVALQLNCIPTKFTGIQNRFSSPPTPFKAHGRNVIVCPANICCYHSGTSSITEMLSAYYTLQIYKQLFSTLTNKQTLS